MTDVVESMLPGSAPAISATVGTLSSMARRWSSTLGRPTVPLGAVGGTTARLITVVVALIALLAMHGVTSVHAAHLLASVDPMPGAAAMVHPEHGSPPVGADHHGAGGMEMALVGCAFAVLVASGSRRRDLVHRQVGRPAHMRAAGQHCAAPEPPVPRFVLL